MNRASRLIRGQSLRGSLSSPGIPRSDQGGGSRSSELSRDLQTDALVGPGDQGNPSLQGSLSHPNSSSNPAVLARVLAARDCGSGGDSVTDSPRERAATPHPTGSAPSANTPSIEKASASLPAAPRTSPIVAPSPARPASPSPRCAVSSPITAPMNGPRRMPGRPKKRPTSAPTSGAHDGPLRRSEPLRTQGGRSEVNRVGQKGQHGEQRERAGTDVGEILRPGSDQEPREEERWSGKRRKEKSEQARQHQDGGQQPQEDCRVHASSAGRRA